MKAITIVALLVVAMVALGWMTFGKTSTNATITIETKEIQTDAEKAVEKSKTALEGAKEALRSDRARE